MPVGEALMLWRQLLHAPLADELLRLTYDDSGHGVFERVSATVQLVSSPAGRLGRSDEFRFRRMWLQRSLQPERTVQTSQAATATRRKAL
jgi:hypothetical protein